MRSLLSWVLLLSVLSNQSICADETRIETLNESLQAYQNEDVMVVDAATADYDGKYVTLNGDVTIDHPLGKIKAQNVVMIPPVEKKKLGISRLKLDERVVIALKEGGELSCENADIDCESFEGTFLGGSDAEYVVYTDNCGDSKGTQVPLVVKSQKMTLAVAGEEKEKEDSPKNFLRDIIAERKVTVNYNHDFIVFADQGIYHRINPENRETASALPGTIVLNGADNGEACQVTNKNGDLIRASQITINTLKREIEFSNPIGTIDTAGAGKEIDKLDFSAKRMNWEDENHVLTLRDQVAVQQKGIGKITSDSQVRILQHMKDGKRIVQTISSEGKTTLTRQEDAKRSNQKLTCQGLVTVDHEHLQTTLESSKQKSSQQVHYQDSMGQILADRVVLSYALEDGGITLSKMTLEGNVKIVNTSENKGEGVSQYALADLVEYSPKEKQMVLTADPNKRVLFLDKSNSLQVSAPKLKILRGEGAKKESIQGVGDVRFNFMENEFEQLRKQFSFDKSGNHEEIHE